MSASHYRKVSSRSSKHPFDTIENLPLSDFAADHAQGSSPISSRSSSRISIQRNKAIESCSKTIEDACPQFEHNGGSNNSPSSPRRLRDASGSSPPQTQTRVVVELFSPLKKKFWKLLAPGLASWLISLLLIGAFFATVTLCQEQVMSSRKKSLFDTITTILSLALGLNIASSLRAISLSLRWWVLTIEKRPAREVDLILHCDSMTKLLQLIFVAPQPRTLVASIFWLSLNILAQAGIAMLSLTFSGDPGIGDIYRAADVGITIPNMTNFVSHGAEGQQGQRRFGYDVFSELFSAHLLGDIGSSYNFSMLPVDYPLAGTPWAANPAAFWNATDHWEYVFLESAPSPLTGSSSSGPNFLSFHSDRVAKSSAICTTPPYNITIHDGLALIDVVSASTNNQTVDFPSIALGLESIYYLTRPAKSGNTIIGNGSCGPGCSEVHVLEPATGPPAPGSVVVNPLQQQQAYYYYHCNITVEMIESSSRNVVVVAGNQQQQQQILLLPPQTAVIAAQAIALSGRIHSELRNSLSTSRSNSNQYFAYNFGLPFGEPQNNSASGMAQQLSRFAIGVLAALAETAPQIYLPTGGQTPKQGIRLKLNAPLAFYLILALIGGIHFALVFFTALVVSPIEIPEEIPWSHREEIQSRFCADVV